MPTPRFFRTGGDFNRWLAKHHDSARELWVGFHKKASGEPSITWPESVDEALCFGWIDGVRKSVDDVSYMIRFTPRRPDSTWSQVNVRRARALIAQKRMRPPGLAAFEARDRKKTRLYSFENRPSTLPPGYLALVKANRDAWTFFRAQPPWYRKTCAWWIVSAKKEETRLRRLATLMDASAEGRTIPPLTRKAPAK
jgi:uncharacterized protein YdeI (YjbR/CyaY-like superfamily)